MATTADDPFDMSGDSDTEDEHEVSQIAGALKWLSGRTIRQKIRW
jgi:hypothetical protein